GRAGLRQEVARVECDALARVQLGGPPIRLKSAESSRQEKGLLRSAFIECVSIRAGPVTRDYVTPKLIWPRIDSETNDCARADLISVTCLPRPERRVESFDMAKY